MTTDLNLQQNEGIILQKEEVIHRNKTCELYLTNLNLICVESSGVFKVKYNITKYPLNQIKTINNLPQVSVVDDKNEGTWVLQIQSKSSIELFAFEYSFFEKIAVKAELDKWVNQISILLTGHPAPTTDDNSLVGSVKNMLGAIGVKTKPQAPENLTTKCIGCMAPISGSKGATIRCKYCDTEQTL